MIFELKEYISAVPSEQVTPAMIANANLLLPRVDQLLVLFREEQPTFPFIMNSGLRTAARNMDIPGAAPNSKHLSGEAIDVADEKARTLARWCLLHYKDLALIGLWCEDLRATPTWVHFQCVPPKSGIRFFIPNAVAATKLAGEPLTDATIQKYHG